MRRVENGMLILGTPPELTPWERFTRLQRRAALLTRGKGFRPGVVKCRSHEELLTWALKNRIT